MNDAGSGSFVAGSGYFRTHILDIPSHSHPGGPRASWPWVLSNDYAGSPVGDLAPGPE